MNVIRDVTLHIETTKEPTDGSPLSVIVLRVQLTSHSTHRNETSYPYTATLPRLSHFP